MDLTLFCDTYIIAEYMRLKGTLETMPRYKAGIHKGTPVIREYSGGGSSRIRHDAHTTGPNYADMQKKLAQYDKYMNAKAVFGAELKRRHLSVPSGFKFIRDPSDFDCSAWELLMPCSNPHEVNTKLYDDYGYNVRSRGEMIIGNVLKDLGLEAKYEPSLLMKGTRKKNPDYSFPVPVIDRCFFVEFMGMTDDDTYIENNYGKIDEYMRNGILPGRDLILICGTKDWLPAQEAMKRRIADFVNEAILNTYKAQK